MIKKMFITILMLAFSLWSFNFANASSIENIEWKNLQTAILQWQLISDSQSASTFWKSLDCSNEDLLNIVNLSVSNPKNYQETLKWLETSDPGKIKDIKWCVLERQMDSIIKWIVYVAIIAFALYSIIIVWSEVLGWGKWNWGWQDWGDQSQGWGWNKVLEKVKIPLWAMAILILISLWALNVLVKLVAWAFDSLV